MKFLCVACDEAMKLDRTSGPDRGSLTVVFTCPSCGRETAMLTNDMETQMVRSLGVKIGGSRRQSEPMESVRASLSQGGEPHAATAPAHDAPVAEASEGVEGAESKCPFTGVIAEAYAKHGAEEIVWTKEAQERIERIPSFARPFVTKGVEMHAREHGYTEINEDVVDEVKSRFGM
jgi:hypothetical protein